MYSSYSTFEALGGGKPKRDSLSAQSSAKETREFSEIAHKNSDDQSLHGNDLTFLTELPIF
jgi:hypothetical protein